MSADTNQPSESAIIDQVHDLNDEVRTLALNLAIYLAKAKTESAEINRLEPAFIRLVNGVVKVVQELAGIVNAARNERATRGMHHLDGLIKDPIEPRLHNILDQCNLILAALTKGKQVEGQRE